ncbi:hypothetical protein JNB88_09480 [Rhizobium cauense]|uniref:hypothetical protein n=1 Tax=Rhizobium cauense TaxID=1166683 RepID=UPI001C6DED50|nr:hypothetical protein [Rhizobium cauense]MBW9113866.1 hypothetical protein [Rhizobium cauense]
MDQKIELTDVQEQRLDLYYRRQLASLLRKDATEKRVEEALSITRDASLPRVALEFRVAEYGCISDRWPFEKGLGAAIENYVSSIRRMQMVRFSNSSFNGLTEEHQEAFDAVVSSARVLEDLEWPVNWEQNVQAILEPTEYGLRGGKLVHRFENLPELTTLGDEMLLLGTLTFYSQSRSGHRDPKPFKAVPLSAANSARYGNIELHLRRHDEQVPDRFRYCSDWMAIASDGCQRIAI